MNSIIVMTERANEAKGRRLMSSPPAFMQCGVLPLQHNAHHGKICGRTRNPIMCSARITGNDRNSLQEYISAKTSGSAREVDRMRVLLDECSLNVLDVWLLFAARVGDAATVSSLLQQNTDPNVADSEGSTPLMRAISRGHVEAAKALMDAPGLDISKKNDWGYDAIIYLGSVRSSKPDAFQKIKKLFEERGIDPSRNELRWTQKPRKSH